MVVNQLQYFPFLHPHFCVVHLCAHVKTQHLLYNLYVLYVSTVASRFLSGVSPWLELKLKQSFPPTVVPICRVHWLCCPCAMAQFLVVRTRLFYADLTSPIKTNKWRSSEVTSKIQLSLSPSISIRVTGQSHHAVTKDCVGGGNRTRASSL